MSSESTILAEFWAEAREELAAQQAAQAAEAAEKLEKARGMIAAAVPAEILGALGIDLAELQWPPRHSDAFAAGRCNFNGVWVETKVTVNGYGQTGLGVGGSSVRLDEKLRANIGIALGQAWRKYMEAVAAGEREAADARKRKVERFVAGANFSDLNDLAIQSKAMTASNLPYMTPEELAAVRSTVARRKWDARRKRHEERRQAAARRAALEARAAELLAVCEAWTAEWDAYNTAGEAWARRWTADLAAAYGPTELWQVTYGPAVWPAIAAGVDEDGESCSDEMVKSTVILESPADLPEAVRRLTLVTEVTQAGQTREAWIGPVLRMDRIPVQESITQQLNYHRSVTCGEWVVNVPPTASKATNPAVDKPTAPMYLGGVLEQNGFRKVANRMRWGDLGSDREVAGLSLAEAVDLLD